MKAGTRHGPLISSGLLLGAGLGGFVDGISLHQILQLHNMLSGWLPPSNLVDAKINMFYDGLFHAAVWIMTVVGLGLLFRAGRRPEVAWSGKSLLGGMVMGWGLFNVIEGIIDHEILGIHHVVEYTDNKLPADLAFLAFGAALILLGAVLIRDASMGGERKL